MVKLRSLATTLTLVTLAAILGRYLQAPSPVAVTTVPPQVIVAQKIQPPFPATAPQTVVAHESRAPELATLEHPDDPYIAIRERAASEESTPHNSSSYFEQVGVAH